MKRERTKQPLLNRILAWSTPEPNSGCWLWLGTLTQYGYGEIFAHGKKHLAHRIAYQEIVGPIPPELCCDHLCRVRSCVNPSRKPEPQAQDNGMLMDIWENGGWKQILVRWNGATYVEVSK